MARYERDSRNWTHARHLPAKLQIIKKKKKINIICYQNYYEGVYERKVRNERGVQTEKE
jgi:ribosomal protein L19E